MILALNRHFWQCAKQEGISISGVNDRIKRGKVMCVETIGKTFIIN